MVFIAGFVNCYSLRIRMEKMKSKRLAVFLTGLLLTAGGLLLTACSGEQTVADSAGAEGGREQAAQAAPSSHNRFIVGIDSRSDPMTFWDDRTNQARGYDVDLAREVMKRVGVEVEFKALQSWDTKEQEIKAGVVDAVWAGMTLTPERTKDFTFTDVYYQSKQIILVSAKSNIADGRGLAGKKIGIKSGSVSGEWARSFAPESVVEFAEYHELCSAIIAGTIDAGIADDVFLEYFNANSPGVFRRLPDELADPGFAVGLRLGETAMAEKMNQAFASMKADGAMQAIYDKWFK